jgi:hypothetical protein
VPGEELERGIHGVLERTPDPPRRVLVVTDSLAIGSAWRLDAGIEHVPGPGERQAELAGVGYEEFLRRRLALVLAHRPRFRRVLTVGAVPDELVAACAAPARRRGRLLARTR